MATGYDTAARPHAFIFAPRNDPVLLRTRHGTRGVALFFVHDYVVVGLEHGRNRYEVRSTAYRYHLLDLDGREILAYHWHPLGQSSVTFAHLHLSSRVRPIELGPDAAPVALAAMHLPIGHISLEDIVHLLITELAVQPHRDDWEVVLHKDRSR